jgi:hypothetical protein
MARAPGLGYYEPYQTETTPPPKTTYTPTPTPTPAAPPGQTRGEFASALFAALGLTTPTSNDKFSDTGDLGGVASTLADLGITVGVGGGKFGTNQVITRGQAFTMIARALGLAGTGDGIATASQALVDAGIVKGYGNTGDLGLNDPLKPEHTVLLMGRITPELDKPSTNPDGSQSTIRDDITDEVLEAEDNAQAEIDPTYAAYLNSIGVSIGQVEDEISLRQELFQEDSRRRSDTYARATERAMEGIATDFENRGLTRSGTRLNKQAERTGQLGYESEQESYQAQRQHEAGQRELNRQLTQLETDRLNARVQSDTTAATDEIQDQY